MPLHQVDGAGLGIAGLCFVIGFVVGLFAAKRYDKATLWVSIVGGLACCLVRAASTPLGFTAIASVSLLHVFVACLFVLILRYTLPAGQSQSTAS